MKKFFSFAAIAVLILVSCRKEDNTVPVGDLTPRKDFVLTKAQMEFIKENNAFALELFRQVSQSEDGQDLLISPLSITIDFGMVSNGAVGQTQQEIYETLGYKESSIDGLNSFCQSMMAQSAAVDPSTTLEIANAAVVNKIYPGLKDSFTKTVESVYDAKVIYKDFGKEDIMKLVNDWCKEKTHGMIPELLTQPVPTSDYAHFLNAVYFKGIWSSRFRKDDTREELFTLEYGYKTTVRMMHQKDRFNYGGIAGLCFAVSLPYGNQAYAMTLLLPIEGKTLAQLLDALDADAWNHLRMHGEVVDVKIPSFETEYFVSLKDILPKMGIKQAFSSRADFSALSSTPNLCIGDVLHKAKIIVDEEGSEAAAVTDIILLEGAAAPGNSPTYLEFHADHPFLYLITEKSTGAILFIGRYTGKS